MVPLKDSEGNVVWVDPFLLWRVVHFDGFEIGRFRKWWAGIGLAFPAEFTRTDESALAFRADLPWVGQIIVQALLSHQSTFFTPSPQLSLFFVTGHQRCSLLGVEPFGAGLMF